MITFVLSVLLLFLGYLFYSRFLEKIIGVDEKRQTPAYSCNDGVDYVPMNWKKVFLIQFLNIAGLGPIFGALLGAMYGPVAFLWIVFGNIFGGAMHDYFSGMMSLRKNGLSLPEIVGEYLGKGAKLFLLIFTVFLMILVGSVFVLGPAKLLSDISGDFFNISFWVIVIFLYYLLATLLPINKIIGRIYPIFGLALLFMALGIFVMMFYYKLPIPELTLSNLHNMKFDSDKFPIFPMMFVTIACGAVSGFHATQSPLMSRCLMNEKEGRKVFYGAMVAEGLVALIWAAVGMSFWGGVKELNQIMMEHGNNAAWGVKEISVNLLGKIGSILAILGVVAAPITTGDTAFRSARLIIADFFRFSQKKLLNRLYITIPIFVVAIVLTQLKFDIIWRYMSWANQTLACFVLWTITVYLSNSQSKYYFIALLPAIFMTFVCSTYICIAPEGFQLQKETSYLIGGFLTMLFTLTFFIVKMRKKNS